MDVVCRGFRGWSVAAALLLLLMPRGRQSVTVHIVNQEPVHVIPGSGLQLRALIQQGPREKIVALTWERRAETGPAPARTVLATCPADAAQTFTCAAAGPRVRAGVDQRGASLQVALLQVDGFGARDAGVYAVTLLDHKGAVTVANCIVREYEAVHHVSVSINVSHSSLVCGEAWGTEPRFSWLHERAAIDAAVGSVSADGTTLYVAMVPMCGHFTCMVSNKLGYSSATYSAAACEGGGGGGATVAIVCLSLLLLLFGGALLFLLWRRHQNTTGAGDSLHQRLEETI